ncbi:MIP/aquaporin family protein [Plantibacter sp. ME-Dv--P-095]|uniref:aquaporin n=1 Tax=Plantibacter sp. ME-Dv--P-095 TaxID=3040299 RepID=UPI00254C6007|nr:MIP/aquaporin family protein [Plantibacter sp. ME-Dv--P-095]
MNPPNPAPTPVRPHLLRRMLAEFVGTGLLVTIVVGSGIMAQRLSPNDVGLQLLQNSLATALGLAVLILILGPVSGAHFNPVVSFVDWWVNRGTPHGLPLRDLLPYVVAQIVGGTAGTVLAGAMFDTEPALSTTDRASAGTLLGEIVATAGLLLVIFALARSGKGAVAAAAVGAYIGAAYWFTSSTSFANPAVTIARMFTDTFAGIAPASVCPFLLAELLGATIGLGLVLLLYPTPARSTAAAVAPHPAAQL